MKPVIGADFGKHFIKFDDLIFVKMVPKFFTRGINGQFWKINNLHDVIKSSGMRDHEIEYRGTCRSVVIRLLNDNVVK